MSLRLRLLLLSLLTLVLPWAGCEYARQMEHVLKTGQEAAILTTAQTLARVIATDVDVFGSASSPQSLTSPPVRDQYAVQLTTHPLLDGFADEWPLTTRSLPSDTSTALSNDSGLRFGLYDGTLYAFLRVSDAQVTYENPMSSAERTTPLPDRVIVLLGSDETSSDGASFQHAWSISAAAPGPIIAHRAVNAAPWLPQSQLDADLRGVWRESADGYYVELRIPQRFVGSRIAIFSSDDAAPTTEEVTLQRLISASAALRERLARYAPPGVRISILNAQGWLLARVGSVGDTTGSYNSAPASQDDASLNVYRFFLGRTEATPAPSYGLPYGMWGEPIDAARRGASSAIWFHATANEPSIVRAAVPILNGDRVAGVIAVEQRGEQLLTQRDAALERLLALTLLTTVFAMGLSLVFGLWLARRIRHLSKAAAHALSPEGHIEQRLPDTAARDELGDLARSYATLLGRLKDYTQYLQTLGAKLTHELRTPLAIVSSSLDNLTAEQTNINAQQYILRARDGANRLHSILTAMSEATRVEQSIEQAERVEFDLAALIRTAGQAYQQTFQTHRIAVQTPSGPCWIRGAPELIAQLLDKLVDNAIDFCPAGGRIDIELQCDSKSYRLNVSNEGPSLPAELADKVFDAMVSNRVSRSSGDARRPHLGLGLYIVQLIARFHRGQVRARNLPEQRGVAFEIQVPRL